MVANGGSRNFKTGGRGPSAVEFLGSGYWFDAPQHKLYIRVVRLENQIHIVHIVS